jgi:hypothetical protein
VRGTFLFLAIAVLLGACDNKRGEIHSYYPVDSLIEAQVSYLAESHASLTKEATIGTNQEDVILSKDTTGWRHELEVFAQLNDINKPTNIGKYHIEPGLKDINSNLLVYSMESTDARPVVFFKIYYLGNRGNIRKIEARYHEQNSLLTSIRNLTMNFEGINNKIVLTSYSITGGQKMLLGDSVQFSVNGMITLP